MIFLSIGLPSRFAEWCDGIICALVRTAAGPFDLASGNTFEEIARALIKSRAPQIVIGARQPTDDLRAALLRTGRRFVVALDDPYAAFQNLVTRHGLEWNAAIRAAAGSCAAMVSCTALPGALVLRADREGRDPTAAATAIAQWLNLEIGPTAIAALVQSQPDPSTMLTPRELDGWWDGIPATDRAVADGALKGYIDHFSGAGMGQIVWARDLFLIGDDPHAAATRAIDVRGPVRNLLFGPYMTLPPGVWEATIVLAVSKEAANLNYSVEVLAGPSCACLARGTIQPRGEGVCELTVEFTVAESTDQPISLRIVNLCWAFNGRLALAHVALSPRLKAPADLPAELKTALGF